MSRLLRLMTTGLVIGSMGVSLSGCLIAAVPLVMAGAAAVGGFAVYKTVQTAGGGTVRIAFDSKDAKKGTPPLPSVGNVAVLGDGPRERKFSQVLAASGKFHVSPIAEANDYETACRARRVDMIFAAVDQGQAVKSNMLSFSRGNSTQTFSVQAYSCATKTVVWSEMMQVIIEAGSKPMVQSEVDDIAGQGWADRIVQAKA